MRDKELTTRWLKVRKELLAQKVVDNDKEFADKIGSTSAGITNITKGYNGVSMKLALRTQAAFPHIISRKGLIDGVGALLLIKKVPPKTDNIAEQLKIITELHSNGSLTDEEFKSAKKRIIGM